MPIGIHVAAFGEDNNSGRADSPVKTLPGALVRLREACARGCGEGAELILDTDLVLESTVELGADVEYGLTVRPAEGKKVCVTSARVLAPTESVQDGKRVWTVDLPQLRQGREFRSLLVNGIGAKRPRLPREGFYEIKYVENIDFEKAKTDPKYKNELYKWWDRFYVNPAEWAGISHVSELELVIPHYWSDEHPTVQSYDPATGLVVMNEASCYSLADDFVARYSRYAIENVREAAIEGEWYTDRETARLIYFPRAGETPANTVLSLPTLTTGIVLRGARDVAFTGLRFCGFDWKLPISRRQAQWDRFGKDIACYGQSASGAEAAVELYDSRRCRFTECLFDEAGGYAVGVESGCRNISIDRCEIKNCGAGGVRVNGGTMDDPEQTRTSGIAVVGCHIHDCCREFMAGCGILSMHASYCRYADNEIHDIIYTGVSVGWVWGYAPSASHHNLIENNHIYNIGKKLLSDMGGIYTLGEQPGTVLRGNVIHDVNGRNYGGWGIYPDEGSSHILIEKNVVYNTGSQAFHQHYGRENIVRENIFAFGGAGTIAFTRPEEHCSASFYDNVILSDGRPLFIQRANKTAEMDIRSDCNLLYDYSGEFSAADGDNDGSEKFAVNRVFSLAQWREMGRDRRSEYRDPGFVDPKHGDFRVKS